MSRAQYPRKGSHRQDPRQAVFPNGSVRHRTLSQVLEEQQHDQHTFKLSAIKQCGIGARHEGISVGLMGTGTQTKGVVLVHQFKMIDLALVQHIP